MSGALQTANQELLRQLQLGQRAIEASMQRLRSGGAGKAVTFDEEKENLPLRGEPAKPEADSEPPKRAPNRGSSDANRLRPDLLEAEGNLRRSRAKPSVDREDDERGIRSILARSGVQRRTTPSRVQFDTAGQAVRASAPPGDKAALLGYDWIAGMLENSGKMEALERSPDFFEQLGTFRRANKEQCVAREFRHESLIEDVVSRIKPGERISRQPPPGQMSVDQILDARDNEEPVFAYTVNERLFPTPLNPETELRDDPTSDSPHIVKVSIPSYRLLPSPSRLQPHRRRSIDENDSFSLVGHCQVGFRPGPGSGGARARPADLPSAAEREAVRRRPRQPKSEAEAIEQLRKAARPKAKIPVDLRPPSSPHVVGALLTRKEMKDLLK